MSLSAKSESAVVASRSQAEKVKVVECGDGLRAWLTEDYAVPLVAFDFAFPGGTAQDVEGKEGVAALMASLLDEGAGDLDAEAFHRAMDDKAIELSFSADRDYVHGRLKTLTRHLDAAFDLLGLALACARLDDDAVDRVRAQVTAGLRRESSDPDALAGRAWRETAFAGHPYGRASRGTLETLPNIRKADLEAARDNLLAREGAVMAAVGAVDAQRLTGLVDRVFSKLPRKGALKAVADVEMAGLGERKLVDLDVPQTTIRFGLPGVARRDPDHMAAVVVNHILGGGIFSARLFKEVREKRGLAYSIHTQLTTQRHTAAFSGGTSTKNDRAAESLAVIEEEIGKLASEGPSAEELEKAKKYLIGSYALRFDTSTKIASQLVHLQIEGFSVDYLDRRNGEIAAVSLEDACRVADRLFAGKKLLVAIAGRPEGL
jgi:zinc protease